MADEKIEVEWIATATRMMATLDSMDKRFEKQEKALQKLSDTGKKGAELVAGSFNKLEQELKDSEAALKNLTIGSSEFTAQKEKVDQMRRSVTAAKKELETQPKESFGTAVKGMAVATGAATMLAAALVKVADAQRGIISAGADQAIVLDQMARRFQIQANLVDDERAKQSQQIIEQSSVAGVRAEVGFAAATQLAGSGFNDAVEKGTLQTVLETIQASSFQGSPEQLVSAFSEALNAYGLEKNNQNLKELAVAAQSLFKQTDFQLTELTDFAKNAAVFRGANIAPQESLAAFTALREVLPAAESSTALRNFISKLQAGDVTKEMKDNFERLGVKADEADFVGEGLVDVLKTLKSRTDVLPEAQRNQALGKMFGMENVAGARLLMQSIERINELRAAQQGGAQFQRDFETASQGMLAERNRIENERLMNILPIGGELAAQENRLQRFENQNQAIINNQMARGNGVVAVGAQAASFVTEKTNVLTGGEVVPQASEGLFQVFRAILGKNDEQARKIDETNELLRQQLQRQAEQQRQPQRAVPNVRPKEAPLPAETAP